MKDSFALKKLVVAAVATAGLLGVHPRAASLATSKPEDVGFSSERLKRIGETIQQHMKAGDISGAVTLVARRGRVAHFEAHGLMDIEARKPMTTDVIFRLASMSKPVTAVAILMLLEEGKLRLNDPVSRFIPEFLAAKVGAPNLAERPAMPGNRAGDEKSALKLVPPIREITIRDLLTHTSGLMSRGASSATTPIERKPHERLADYVPRLAGSALDFQPGTAWSYSPGAGIDVLGRVVEVISGLSFDQFLKTRLFDPLGMKDTAFTVDAARAPRVATLYRRGDKGLQRLPNQTGVIDTVYFSGAGGLAGTAEDYLQFAQMLVSGGQLNGKRLLGPKTVDLMASDHVGDLYAKGCAHETLGPCDFYDQRGMGFGLGVDVVRDAVAAGIGVSDGSFGWAGAYGTRFWVDRKEQMVTILMVSTRVVTVQRDFEFAVRQALIE
jgi:CubicO group peptidase (beta-lactamase class C family)